MMTHRYAELQTTTNFSFLRGASQAWELMETAEGLGLAAVGVADRNTLAGVVRAWTAAKTLKVRALTGCRLDFADGTPSLLCYPSDREAFARLTRLLTVGRGGPRRANATCSGRTSWSTPTASWPWSRRRPDWTRPSRPT
jgi:error-prone DNA polymerase